jgi:hypothetical protein
VDVFVARFLFASAKRFNHDVNRRTWGECKPVFEP